MAKADRITESLSYYLDMFRDQLKELAAESSLEERLQNDKAFSRNVTDLLRLERYLSFDNPHGTDFHTMTYSCPAAVDTIFVSRNGNIHCCSKVDQTFPLGDVSKGLDKQAISSMYASYFKKIDAQCKRCWAFWLCKLCPAMVFSKGKPNLPKKHECEQLRKGAELSLMRYVVLTEEFEPLYNRLTDLFFSDGRDFKFDSKPTLIKQFNYGTN